MTYMPTLPSSDNTPWARPTAINASGVVTGEGTTPVSGHYHAARWDPPTNAVSDLGTLPGDGAYSAGFSINTAGVIVGQSHVGFNVVPYHACRWDPVTHAVLDLPARLAVHVLADMTCPIPA